jgi:hypothetical protein
MFSWLKRITNKFFQKTTSINQQPLDRVSIGIIIILDIFVLFNVFGGLDNISQWPLNPTEEIPCHTAYQTYQTDKNKGSFELNATTLENIIEKYKFPQPEITNPQKRLGKISDLCKPYLSLEKSLNTEKNQAIKTTIDRLRENNNKLDNEIKTLKSQYDSTLIEKIAGQTQDKSINQATADNIKEKIEFKQLEIKQNKLEIENQQKELINQKNAQELLSLLNNDSQYETIKKTYQSAAFWYPNKQLLLQGLFLLPLILISYFWHSYAIKTNKNLQILITWHLLLIFCLPLVVKIFEFIQFGNLVKIAIEFITTILGGLLFLASYVYIVIIPLVGIGLIKFLQRFVFNTQIQAKRRIEKVRCINCNEKIRLTDEFCFNCGYSQFRECPNCHEKTYKFTNFCHKCGYQIGGKHN